MENIDPKLFILWIFNAYMRMCVFSAVCWFVCAYVCQQTHVCILTPYMHVEVREKYVGVFYQEHHQDTLKHSFQLPRAHQLN